jgi:hypothetical protein
MTNDDVDSTGRRRVLEAVAREDGFRNAESVYRAVAALRDQLPDEARRQVVVMLEWAREGIARQNGEATAELAALHAAYTYARDVLAGIRVRDGDERSQ